MKSKDNCWFNFGDIMMSDQSKIDFTQNSKKSSCSNGKVTINKKGIIHYSQQFMVNNFKPY